MKTSTKLLLIGICLVGMSTLWFTQAGDWLYYTMGTLLLLSGILTLTLFDLTRCEEYRERMNTELYERMDYD